MSRPSPPLGRVGARVLGRAGLLAALAGCGGGVGSGDAAADGGPGTAADRPVEEPDLTEPQGLGCASVEWLRPLGALPLSNTLRLGGTFRDDCGAGVRIAVSLDGIALPPVSLEVVPEAERYGLEADDGPDDAGSADTAAPDADATDAGAGDVGGDAAAPHSGRWHLTTDVWCALGQGLDPSGIHRLVVEAQLPAGDGGEARAGARAFAVTFGGEEPATDMLPWSSASGRTGSDPGNPARSPETREHTVMVPLGGEPRAYAYQVTVPPGYDPKTPTPVLILMHGWSRDATDYQHFPDDSGMRGPVAARGILLVSPQGHWWNAAADIGAYGCLARQCEIRTGHNWYTPVFQAVTADLVARYSVDPLRVSVAGFSCGASYAYCLGVSYPGKLAAAVVMDANQAPTNPSYGPYGYFPIDMVRPPNLIFVTGAARREWEARFGPGGNVPPAFCLPVTYHWSGSTSHAWFDDFDPEIVDFVAGAHVAP